MKPKIGGPKMLPNRLMVTEYPTAKPVTSALANYETRTKLRPAQPIAPNPKTVKTMAKTE